jgi:hypothetical protein
MLQLRRTSIIPPRPAREVNMANKPWPGDWAARLSRTLLRRRSILSLPLAGTAAVPLHAALERPGSPTDHGSVLTVIQLHNTQGNAEQAADFVSPMFGQAFAKGQLPAGMFPRFVLSDGTACPATLWGISSWPDGSMKFCAAMLRVPVAVAASGNVEVQVRTGGAKPSPGQRTVQDLLSAELHIELEGQTALEGRWTAALAEGIKAGSNTVLVGSGPAGTIWRIGSEFRDASGAAHGQLYCWHYVAALTGASDQLIGLRYLGRVAQPWTDVRTPAARNREFAAVLKSGSSIVRTLAGHTTTEAPGKIIRLPHYASFFTAGSTARWDYVQGAGSATRDCTVRVVLDVDHLVRSRLVPPYDRRTPIDAAPAVGYVPMGRGTVMRAMGTTGEREDIGVLPEWNVRHLLSQAADHEQIMRVNALSAGGWRFGFRKRTTLQPVPCVDLRPQYAGLGAPEPGWRGLLHMTGMTVPTPNDSIWREDAAHRPGCVYWPYLFTGEPQYLDLLVEHAFAHMLELNQGNGTVWGTTFPRKDIFEGPWRGERGTRIGVGGKLYKGSGLLLHGTGGTRITAWRSRDVVQAAALAPDVAADRADVRTYLRDVIQSAHAAFRDYTGKVPASYRDSGMFVQSKANGAPWMVSYLSWSACHQADILGTPEAAYVRNYLSRFWSSFAETADIGCLVAYTCIFWDDDEQLARSTEDVLGSLDCMLSFKAASSRVFISPDKAGNGGSWKPHDGDAFQFFPKRSPEIAQLLGQRRSRKFYAINCSGQSFQLASAPGGTPITFDADATTSRFFARLKDFSPDLSFSATNASSGYLANIRGAVAYHLACGDAVESVKGKLDRIVEGRRVKFNNNPKYCVVGHRD